MVLLRSVKEEAYTFENGEEANNNNKLSVPGLIFLILSMAFLIAAAVFEIMNRLGTA